MELDESSLRGIVPPKLNAGLKIKKNVEMKQIPPQAKCQIALEGKLNSSDVVVKNIYYCKKLIQKYKA